MRREAKPRLLRRGISLKTEEVTFCSRNLPSDLKDKLKIMLVPSLTAFRVHEPLAIRFSISPLLVYLHPTIIACVLSRKYSYRSPLTSVRSCPSSSSATIRRGVHHSNSHFHSLTLASSPDVLRTVPVTFHSTRTLPTLPPAPLAPDAAAAPLPLLLLSSSSASISARQTSALSSSSSGV